MISIDAAITDLANARSDDTVEDCCDALAASIEYYGTELTQDQANRAMATVRTLDRDENYHAAHIRDAIRDNTELEISS